MRTDLRPAVPATSTLATSQAAVATPSAKVPLAPLAQPGVAQPGAEQRDAATTALDTNSATTASRVASPGSVPPSTGQAADASQTVDQAALQQSLDHLNRFIQPREGSIEFTLDVASGKALLQVVDTETKAVLLQVPSKQALALSQSIGQATGQLIKDQA